MAYRYGERRSAKHSSAANRPTIRAELFATNARRGRRLHFSFMANRFAFRLRYVLFIAWLVSCGAPEIGIKPPGGMSMPVADVTRVSSEPASATPLPALTPAPFLPPLVPPPDTEAVWSPDHKWYATTQSFCSTAVVVDPDRQRVAQLPMTNSVCGQVRDWTADSRFAIFGERHAKGNATTYVFDAQTWDWILETPGCIIHSTGDYLGWEPCGDYPAALSPNAPRLLMENGHLISLPDLQDSDLLPGLRDRRPMIQHGYYGGYVASWSPDGAYLAFVTVINRRPGYADYEFALYLALGDGTQVRQVVRLESFPRSLQWTEAGRTVIVVTGADDVVVAQTYMLDVLTGQVQITPGPPTSVPSATPLIVSPTPAPTRTPFLTPTP